MGSFILDYPGDYLFTKIKVISGMREKTIVGVFDTGANISCITEDVARELCLKKVSKDDDISQGVHGKGKISLYIIDIKLQSGDLFENIKVGTIVPQHVRHNAIINGTGKIIDTTIKALIGTDIISQGDLIISNYGGSHRFKFIMPPQKENIPKK